MTTHKTCKRDAIMQAAEKLFTSRRYHEITLDDIVREARIGKGTIYTYFKGKDDLFLQVGMSGFEDLCKLLQRRIDANEPFRAQLFEACEEISAFFARRKQLFRMIQSEDARMSLCRGSVREQWQERRRQLHEMVGRIVRKGQAEGVVRDDIGCEVLAGFLMGLLRARVREVRDSAGEAPDALLADFFLSGAGRRGAASRIETATDPVESELQE
jgi:AcrR family transcriptional regulator